MVYHIVEGDAMKTRLPSFDPRQNMFKPGYEIAHKQDTYLKDVQLHHHDFYEVYFLMSGDVTYAIESNIYHLMPGDVLLISPQELHQMFVQPDMSPYERYVLWIDSELLSQLSSPAADLSRCFDRRRDNFSNLLHLDPELRSTIRSLMEAIYQESQQHLFGEDVLSTALLTSLMVQINRAALSAVAPQAVSRSGKVISEVISYINLHYSEPLSLDQLAERFYMSKYHLSHEFNRQIGISVYKYILKKRLLIARQLLAQGRRPNDVYAECGFKDYPGFFRAFRSEYDIAPREYYDSVHAEDLETAKITNFQHSIR